MTKLPPRFSRALAEARIKLRPMQTRARRKAYAKAAQAKWRKVLDSAAESRADLDKRAHEAASIIESHRARAKKATQEAEASEQKAQPGPQPKRASRDRRRPSPKPQRTSRHEAKRREKHKRDEKHAREPRGGIDALGWFALAAVILAWPREHGLLGDPDAPPLFPGLSRRTSEAEVAMAAALEPGRGRAAHNPRQIPLEGWKDILLRTFKDFSADRITTVAGGVTFFGLLALFPAMGAFVSLYGLFADVATAQKQLTLLAGVLPGDALTFIGDQMVRIAKARSSSLGFAFVVSLLISIWSANGGMQALINGLNVAFEEKEKRGLVKLNLVSLAFTVGAIAFLLLALGGVVVAPVVTDWLGIGAGSVMPVLRWPLLFVLVMLALSVLYRYGPSRSHERWKWVSWGSAIGALLWLLASLLFSAYVSHFAHYNKTYGSLGAVIGFMTWMWVSTIVVLFGAELNSEIEHQTAVDTTTGAPKPMGIRGAKMADTLGEARKPKKPRR